MAENYKFHLARWSERDKSLRCPQCGKGKGCYKEYVDVNGVPVDPINHTCGKCDHETSCGYHITPSMFFSKNPEAKERETIIPDIPSKEVVMIIIPEWMVQQSINIEKYNKNIFVQWLLSLPLTDENRRYAMQMLQSYFVGTTHDGGTLWFQIDEQGRARTAKKIIYKPNGHRLKDEEGNSKGFNWAHAMARKKYQMFLETKDTYYKLCQCLFGLHMAVAFPTAEVCIVESEKTALLMAILDDVLPNVRVWVATGGLYQLNASLLIPLSRRNITLYPDSNGVEKWKGQLKGVPNVKVNTSWMRLLTEADPPGADIADVAVRMLMESRTKEPTPTPLPLLEQMKRQNPNLITLIEKFKLVTTDIPP